MRYRNLCLPGGQNLLIDECEAAGVPRFMPSDWSTDFSKLQLGQLFPKDPNILVKAHLETKKTVKGVHTLIGVFMQTFLSPFFGVVGVDAEKVTVRYWG